MSNSEPFSYNFWQWAHLKNKNPNEKLLKGGCIHERPLSRMLSHISLNDIDSEIEHEANNDLFVERDDIKTNSVGCKNCKKSFVNLIDLEAHLNAHSETIN